MRYACSKFQFFQVTEIRFFELVSMLPPHISPHNHGNWMQQIAPVASFLTADCRIQRRWQLCGEVRRTPALGSREQVGRADEEAEISCARHRKTVGGGEAYLKSFRAFL